MTETKQRSMRLGDAWEKLQSIAERTTLRSVSEVVRKLVDHYGENLVRRYRK